MALTERLRREEEEKKKAATPATQETEGPTVKEILADDEQSELFADYLEAEKKEELAKRIAEGKLDSGDFAQLAKERKTFLKRTEEAEKIKELMNSGLLDQAVASSPELKKIENLVGMEDLRGIALKMFKKLAMTNKAGFDSLKKKGLALTENKADREKFDKEIELACEENRITEEDYMKALDATDPKAAFTKLIKARMGLLERWAKGKAAVELEINDEIAKLNKKADAQKLNKDYNARIKSLAGGLQTTLFKHEWAKMGLNSVLRGEAREEGEWTMSFDEFMQSTKNLSEAQIKKAWAERKNKLEADFKKKKENKDRPVPDFDKDGAEKARFSEEYLGSNIPRNKKGSGWGKVLGSMFPTDIIEGFIK